MSTHTTDSNPLLQNFDLKDQATPFHLIKTENYLPALNSALAVAKEKISTIKAQKEITFANTIVALEEASEKVDTIAGIYFNLFSAEANEQHQALAQEISQVLSSFSSDISLDLELFQKIKFVYDHRQKLNLTPEQDRLTEKMYLDFARNGAQLPPDKKNRLRELDQELSIMSPQFSENVLKATNAYELWIEDKKDLSGLPEGAIEAAAIAADQKGKKGQWLFTLNAPSLIPFLTYADNCQLREKLWRASSTKAYGGEFDNSTLVKKTITLKNERAQLLGYTTFADYVLEERMAKDTDTVFTFLKRLIEPSKQAAQRDLEEVQAFRNELEGTSEIKPWDFAYYSEKLKEKKYAFNDEELRPYFKLENVIDGVFQHAQKLYGLTFKPITGIPVYHPDVKTFEVHDHSTNDYIGLFYMDFFPRETKKGGAWMTSYREQGTWGGSVKRPHVSIVCNFTKPTPTKPSLLTYDEVQTLFHEFGHALHGLLSKCTYRSLSGTNVYWDFVELPSQIMENWTGEKEGLDLFARHFETNEPLPTELVQKIKKAAKFQAGWMSLRQLSYAWLDMKWHTTNPELIKDVDQFETEVDDFTRLLPKEPGTNKSCSFSHIFGGGYAAGYYSYKWAEVLDADAFEFFKEKGLFNDEVAAKFKNSILSRGGTAHPMDLYKEFRGREPDPNSLLRRDGLI
ncbi:MAG: peptidase M3 [Bdellovibrionales bacterium RIFCSPHIGHO2_01_FULL_40_29]|nr:MAG: peptidase M3 [Bdellovibrionales bacterium RIFCSPHIGHO2_01_FULL_40_29]OFZ34002.1 MAG: peptidase M3 [Bdellovibrionales bacterium RIFCSPHIGHO2_02_FULL_40_15]